MSLELTFSAPRMVLDIPAYFPNAIKLKNGDILVQLLWGDDRVPTQDEYDEFYAFDGPATADDWKRFNDERQAKNPSHCHVLTGHWARSVDGGKTFTETCLPPIIEYAELDNGDVIGLQWYSYHDKNGAPIVRSWRSHDGCRSWDAPVDIPMICPPLKGSMLVPHRRIVPLGGDSFLVLMYGRLVGDEHDRSMVFRTVDGFKTLHFYSTAGMWRPGIESSFGLNETDMARLPDGRLLCVMRNQSFLPMYQTHSIDDGATWTPVVNFGDSGVDPALAVLQNGVTVCSYGRPGVKVAFSENGGDDWQKRTVLLMGAWEQNGSSIAPNAHPPVRTCSYTDVLESTPNTATVFYAGPKDWSDDENKNPWNTVERNDFRMYAVDVTVKRS